MLFRSPVSAQPATVSTGLTVDQILAQLDSLGEDKAAKKALIASLPSDLDSAVRAALKAQKEEKERKHREADAELDDLL